MTSWTVTQTHRYKSAVEGAGITDWMSFIPTSDIGQVDYDRRLQEKDPMPLLKFSAVMYADRVTTPLLILHGEADLRVPTFQGREYYVLLAERGKTVRMGDLSRFAAFSAACRATARCVERSWGLAEPVRSVGRQYFEPIHAACWFESAGCGRQAARDVVGDVRVEQLVELTSQRARSIRDHLAGNFADANRVAIRR